MLKNPTYFLAGLAFLLGACSAADDSAEMVGADDAADVAAQDSVPTQVGALLFNANRSFIGEATVTDSEGRLSIALTVSDLAPGAHAAHIHAIGACDPPDFATAGNHWMMDHAAMDHAAMDHGAMGMAMDIGALPDIIVNADGTGSLTADLPEGAVMSSLMDADGASILIHAGAAGPDSAPSDNPQAALACGVFAARS